MQDCYALDPERYIQEQNYKVIGDISCNRMTELLKETEELLKATKHGIEDYENNAAEIEQKEIEREQQLVRNIILTNFIYSD